MTLDEFEKLNINKRVRMWKIDSIKGFYQVFGHVTKIDKKLRELQILFDGDEKPKKLGYTRLHVVD